MKTRGVVFALFSFLCLSICLSTQPVSAQTASATIDGRITDPQGNSVQAVEVKAVNIDTNSEFTSQTNDAGIYVLSNLPPGRYRLLVRKEGFKEINKLNLELHVQDTVEQNLTLEIGSVSQSITVTETATPLNTETARIILQHQQHDGAGPARRRRWCAAQPLGSGGIDAGGQEL